MEKTNDEITPVFNYLLVYENDDVTEEFNSPIGLEDGTIFSYNGSDFKVTLTDCYRILAENI